LKAALIMLLLLLGGCYDPVHLDAVKSLGDEATDVPRGPEHRPGQPCTTCHGGEGPADLELSVAGTIFAVRGTSTPLPGATVRITDARGETRSPQTNAAGNFLVRTDEWSPAFPLRVTLEDPSGARKEMITTIGQSGSCAACHAGNGDTSTMPAVFARDR
jgi:hypothetical protein